MFYKPKDFDFYLNFFKLIPIFDELFVIKLIIMENEPNISTDFEMTRRGITDFNDVLNNFCLFLKINSRISSSNMSKMNILLISKQKMLLAPRLKKCMIRTNSIQVYKVLSWFNKISLD